MKKTATFLFLLVALLAGACSDGGPVGFYDPARVANESTFARSLLTEPYRRLEAASNAVAAAQSKVDKAGEHELADAKAKADAALGEQRAAQDAVKLASDRLDSRIDVVVTPIAERRRMRLVIAFGGRPTYSDPRSNLTSEIVAALDGDARLAEAREAQRAAADRVRSLEAAAAVRAKPDGGSK